MKKIAAVCLVHKGPQVLAVSRGSNINDLGLPGGKKELGETPENCAIRELAEETGLYAGELNLLAIDNDEMGFLVYTYEVENFTGKLRSSSEGIAKWVDPEELLHYSCTFKKANRKNLKKAGLI